jgi:hypothetical protein
LPLSLTYFFGAELTCFSLVLQWQVYEKWNQRLFEEMLGAYHAGRSEKDPSLGWYQGELVFFDNYIIPLAKKLKDCGVFGVASDEYLNYATENRREWAAKGKDVVQKFLEEYDESTETRTMPVSFPSKGTRLVNG